MCETLEKEIVLQKLKEKDIIVDTIICKEKNDNQIFFEVFKDNLEFEIAVEKHNLSLPMFFVDNNNKDYPLTKEYIDYIIKR